MTFIFFGNEKVTQRIKKEQNELCKDDKAGVDIIYV